MARRDEMDGIMTGRARLLSDLQSINDVYGGAAASTGKLATVDRSPVGSICVVRDTAGYTV